MAMPRSCSASEDLVEADRREEALDASGQLGWRYMKCSRRVVREHVPAVEQAVKKCETAKQKRRYLASVRDEADAVYWAYCHNHPGDVLERKGEDPEADRRNADYRYIGQYVKPWSDIDKKRKLKRDAHGSPISVDQTQSETFGAWTTQWQDGPSRFGEEALEAVGPKGEVADVEVSPPAGSSWGELTESQQREKKGYDGKKRRRQRKDLIKLKPGRLVLKRLRTRFTVSEAVAAKPGTVREPAPVNELARKEKAAEDPEKEPDSGYSSFNGKSTRG